MSETTIVENPEMFEPGTQGCHEVYYMVALLADLVEEHLCQHPSIQLNPQWKDFATTAHENLSTLYQRIGQVHVADVLQKRAVNYYKNDIFDERACDHCGRPYRGPAVYCSLTCAQADV